MLPSSVRSSSACPLPYRRPLRDQRKRRLRFWEVTRRRSTATLRNSRTLRKCIQTALRMHRVAISVDSRATKCRSHSRMQRLHLMLDRWAMWSPRIVESTWFWGQRSRTKGPLISVFEDQLASNPMYILLRNVWYYATVACPPDHQINEPWYITIPSQTWHRHSRPDV